MIASLYYLREYLFPQGCGGCGEVLISREEAGYGLCETCKNFLETVLNEKNRCIMCGKLLITEKDTCLSCRKKQPDKYFDKALAVFPYTGKFKTILGSYKFQKSPGVGNYFTRCLNKNIVNLGIETDTAAWVPVPPRPGKIKKQGWDQIEFLAKRLDRLYNSGNRKYNFSDTCLPVTRCLRRLPSKSQKKLNRKERKSNLKGRILCISKPPETAVLFDDVITTGATMNACAEALLNAGTKKIYGVCLFYD